MYQRAARSQSHTVLQRAFEFNGARDLPDNREGRLSKKQRRNWYLEIAANVLLIYPLLSSILLLPILILLLGFDIPSLVRDMLGVEEDSAGEIIGTIVIGVLIALALTSILWVRGFLDKLQGEVRSVKGHVIGRGKWSMSDLITFYNAVLARRRKLEHRTRIAVNDVEFVVLERQSKLLNQVGGELVLYYLPRSKKIMSVEVTE